jgi:DNA-directed RNA polymerase specialized sigma24 family protein
MDEHLAREVARGLREGRPDAWRTLYDAFAERVWCGVARLLGPASAEVADVVQETMIAAAHSARTFDEASGSLWNWLWGIARHQAALHVRKQKRHDQLKHAGGRLAASAGRLAHWLDGIEEAPASLLETAELALLVRRVRIAPDREVPRRRLGRRDRRPGAQYRNGRAVETRPRPGGLPQGLPPADRRQPDRRGDLP